MKFEENIIIVWPKKYDEEKLEGSTKRETIKSEQLF